MKSKDDEVQLLQETKSNSISTNQLRVKKKSLLPLIFYLILICEIIGYSLKTKQKLTSMTSESTTFYSGVELNYTTTKSSIQKIYVDASLIHTSYKIDEPKSFVYSVRIESFSQGHETYYKEHQPIIWNKTAGDVFPVAHFSQLLGEQHLIHFDFLTNTTNVEGYIFYTNVLHANPYITLQAVSLIFLVIILLSSILLFKFKFPLFIIVWCALAQISVLFINTEKALLHSSAKFLPALFVSSFRSYYPYFDSQQMSIPVFIISLVFEIMFRWACNDSFTNIISPNICAESLLFMLFLVCYNIFAIVSLQKITIRNLIFFLPNLVSLVSKAAAIFYRFGKNTILLNLLDVNPYTISIICGLSCLQNLFEDV